jgi:hypothetical protein
VGVCLFVVCLLLSVVSGFLKDMGLGLEEEEQEEEANLSVMCNSL